MIPFIPHHSPDKVCLQIRFFRPITLQFIDIINLYRKKWQESRDMGSNDHIAAEIIFLSRNNDMPGFWPLKALTLFEMI
jgi:hypothetical protein